MRKRFKEAQKIVDEEQSDAKNYDGYNTLLAETLANLRSEAWIAWEKKKMGM